MTIWKRLASAGQLGHTAIGDTLRVRIQTPSQSIITTIQRRTFRFGPSLQTRERQKSQSRTNLNPQRSEETKSGTDSEAAEHQSSYDPTKTGPETELEASEEETKQEGKASSPLEVSGANQDVSRARDPQEGGADRNAEKSGPSSRGFPRKGKKVNFTRNN